MAVDPSMANNSIDSIESIESNDSIDSNDPIELRGNKFESSSLQTLTYA